MIGFMSIRMHDVLIFELFVVHELIIERYLICDVLCSAIVFYGTWIWMCIPFGCGPFRDVGEYKSLSLNM